MLFHSILIVVVIRQEQAGTARKTMEDPLGQEAGAVVVPVDHQQQMHHEPPGQESPLDPNEHVIKDVAIADANAAPGDAPPERTLNTKMCVIALVVGIAVVVAGAFVVGSFMATPTPTARTAPTPPDFSPQVSNSLRP